MNPDSEQDEDEFADTVHELDEAPIEGLGELGDCHDEETWCRVDETEELP